MTKSIKNNLIRILTFIVAVTCAFSILTMPKTSAMADNATPALEHFWMEDSAELNVTSLEKSGIRFTAGANINWARYTAQDYSLGKMYPDAKDYLFGIVIADKYYRDQNGDLQERTEVTAETPTAIKIGYIHKSQFESVNPATGQSWFTGGVTKYTASITYREDRLAADFIAHDMAVRAGEKEGNCYFSNEVASANYEGELFDEEFAELMDKVHAEKLMARAYVEITYEDGSKEYVYSENSITNSVRGIATDKYIENKDDESWMAQNGFIAEKYLGTISTKSAYLDSQSNKIVGQDLRGYEEFILNDVLLSVGEDIIVNETSTLSASVVEGLEVGQTYTLTAIDSRGNVLFLNVTPATEVITTAEQFKSIFNLSTNNERCVNRGSFYSCTVDGYYVLGNDIDMTGVTLDHNLVCAYDSSTTVSAFGVGFYGTFDGNGYTISNLNVARSVKNFKMTQSGDFMILNKDGSGVATGTTASYYPSIAANHSCGHSSGTGVGVFASLGYGATIKNVALTNVNASDSSVIAMFTEGGSTLDGGSEWGTFAGFEEVDAAGYAIRYSKTSSGVDISTTCTGGADCPVHGEADCTATQGTKFVKCKGTIGCVHCQTMEAHDPVFYPVVLENSYYNVAIREGNIYNRVEQSYGTLATAKANAGINYENLYIDINDQTTSFRGIFNSFGNAKVDAITTINNVVVNYNGANVTANNYGLLRGENKLATATSYKDVNFGATAINNFVIVTDKTANLINYNGNYVASNLEGTNKIAGILQYVSLEEYASAIEAGTASMEGFGSYWETEKTQTPTWKNDFTKVTFKVDGEVVGNSFEYTALALGEQKTLQVTAYDYQGEQITEFDVAKTTDELVATVNKSGLITVKGETNKTEASTIITLEANGKTFIATITIQGGFILVNDVEVVYDEYSSQFNFNGFAVDVDNDDTNDNSVVFNNDTILSATVIYGNETTTLEKTTVNYTDYGTINGKNWEEVPGYVGASSGNRDSNGTGDDTIKQRTGFVGNVVKFAVNGEYGNYTPVLYTQQLMVTVQVGEEVKTYVFANLKAYSAIITNIAQMGDIFKITASDPLNYGYYVLANNIQPQRGGGLYKYVHENLSGVERGFQGVFDGQGYQINEGFHVNGSNEFGSLFGVIRSTSEMPSTIRNLSASQYSASTEYTLFARSIESDVYENVDAGNTTIKVAKYPVEFKNIHIKPKTKVIHGVVRSDSGTVAYKFKNVLINFENLSTTNGQNNGNGSLLSGNTTMLVSNANPGYNETTHQPQMLGLARDAYYTNAYENVVAIMNFPVMSFIKSSTSTKVDTRDPLDIYLTAYGWNRIDKAGVALSKYVYGVTDNVLAVLSSQATLTPFAGTEENSYADATPYATQLTTGTYTGESGTAYSTVMEQAFFFKGIWQYYSFSDAVAQYNNEASGEKAMFDEMVATGVFTKRASDSKLIWAVAGAAN